MVGRLRPDSNTGGPRSFIRQDGTVGATYEVIVDRVIFLGSGCEPGDAADAELYTLPGIGPATARNIIAYREQHGPFPSIESLLYVRRIGSVKLETLRDLVTME